MQEALIGCVFNKCNFFPFERSLGQFCRVKHIYAHGLIRTATNASSPQSSLFLFVVITATLNTCAIPHTGGRRGERGTRLLNERQNSACVHLINAMQIPPAAINQQTHHANAPSSATHTLIFSKDVFDVRCWACIERCISSRAH